MTDPRRLAVQALRAVQADGAYSNLALRTLLRKNRLSPADARLASTLFYGVLERRITLDYWLDSLMKQPVSKTSPLTLEILRVGLYQLQFLDRIPASAAINEAVRQVKASPERYNAGFVNAVLRAATRTPLPLPQGDTPEALAIRCSCALPIVRSFCDDYGARDAAGLLEAALLPPPVTLRVNPLRTTVDALCDAFRADGIAAKPAAFPGAVELDGGFDLAADPRYTAGLFHVQDVASQQCVAALAPEPGQRVLDLCAAPGGKSFTAAESMQNHGELVSCDLHPHRVDLIRQGAARLGLTCLQPRTADGTVYNSALGTFDRVLCDVPCSGLGVLRRKPELKYQPFPPDGLPELQGRLLAVAARYLRRDGTLVYSTCTLRRAENEDVVAAFLAAHPDFTLCREETRLPHRDGTDGFYFAVLAQKR